MADEPTLKRVTIQYHTTRDDKDHDTKLNTWVFLNKQTIAERLGYAAPNERFPDNTDSPVYELEKVVTVTKKSDVLKGVKCKISMETVGDDNWWFKFTIAFEFSDNSRATMTSRETRFDDDEKTEEEFDVEPH